jgi:hypothetical protein
VRAGDAVEPIRNACPRCDGARQIIVTSPMNPHELATVRALAIKQQAPHTNARTKFTCDECPSAPTCDYVFDAYNTGGDCLAAK